MYTMAASVASQRLPWEPAKIMQEELSTVLSNRSAAYAANADYVASLVDADVVIQLKRPWSKGHFRKAKALLGLGYLQEAKEAIQLGLSFEPTNAVSYYVRGNIRLSLMTSCAGNAGFLG